VVEHEDRPIALRRARSPLAAPAADVAPLLDASEQDRTGMFWG
jgi:hypothetical protein